ncbi:MAG: hypothetical protein QOK31_1006 [Solirubrobacteraceae bacterium]|jgi:putative FmdB family regulatory protein|nr:hypothetical protein [Solirubrobacteraceae bacterium]
MPIYEYRCEQGHTFEVLQRMTDDPLVTCQTCSAPVQRVMYAPAVHFKGSGFYNTDYGTKKRARELKEAGEGTGKHADEGSSSSDGKSSDSSSPGDAKTDSKKGEGSGAKSDPKPKPAAKTTE